ncbi:MAG TPA: dTDP-4-dehydrorhamnose 3,5-epimerase [Gammaproteobacteria bacterium]|nr:dTDP-4-dehydrorhamnose 3,5-epimerase [Gammaproteobacteria bacterium]
MRVQKLDIPDVQLLEPDVHGDQRGFFLEYFHAGKFQAQGLDLTLVQCNHSRSDQGVLRGLHYQLQQPQGKLVQVIRGAVFDVVVDIRQGSPTFGRWVGQLLSEENHHQLYVPPGLAHGFCVLSDSTDFLYFCTDLYRPDDEYGIAWDDPALGIEWPGGPFSLSEKDRNNPTLADAGDFLPQYRG